jgi:L-ascorbate metabolism protein UlaG (beta-lactamase superfamily)
MKVKFLIACIFAFGFVSLNAQTKKQELNITYVANDGYLISSAAKKVLIDALFTEGYGFFITPSKEIINSMLKAEKPFDNVNLCLLTHHHDDHLNPELLIDYLTQQKSVHLVTSKTSLDFIDQKKKIPALLKDRIHEITPPLFKSLSETGNGISVKSTALKHMARMKDGVDLNTGYFNTSFLVDMDGIKVFHAGDINLDSFQEYVKQNGEWDDKVDVAFLYFQNFENGETDLSYIIETLYPKYIVVMHLPPSYMAEWTPKIEKLRTKFPNFLLFTKEGETQTLSIDTSN